jgi:DNA-binding LacI/PurR family transcriptional regulator
MHRELKIFHRPMAQSPSRSTSLQVARAAGVSLSAVSRAFMPGAAIAEDTRARVLSAARAVGYVPRTLARGAMTLPPTVAVVMADITNPFFPEVLERLTLSLRARGFAVQLHCPPRGSDVDSVIPDLFRAPLAGVLMGSATVSSHLARLCREQGIPVVLLNRAAPGPGVSMVGCDNHEGGHRVAGLFRHTGCRSPAFIGGRPEIGSGIERERGFRDGLAAAGLPLIAVENGGFTYEGGQEAARRLFAGPLRPDAVFCANDVMALATLDHLRHELRLRVPEDVSVVGFDDIAMAGWPAYRLTTVRQRLDVMAEEAIDLLQRLAADPDSAGTSRLVPGLLMERGTTRPSPVGEGGGHGDNAR